MTARPLGCAVVFPRWNVVFQPHRPTLRPRVKRCLYADVYDVNDIGHRLKTVLTPPIVAVMEHPEPRLGCQQTGIHVLLPAQAVQA